MKGVLSAWAIALTLCLAVNAQPQSSSPWPVFGRSSAHGSRADVDTPTSINLFWNTTVNAEIAAAPTIAADGTIYVGDQHGYLYAIEPEQGAIKWTYRAGTNDNYGIHSAPAIDESGHLYFGSMNHMIYSITSRGILRWAYTTGNSIMGSAAIDSKGHIVIGSSDSYLYSLNRDGTLYWKHLFPGPISSTPAIGSDGTIYVLVSGGGLYALSNDGSTELWKVVDTLLTESSPIVTSDTVYAVVGYYLKAFTMTGAQKWSFGVGDSVGAMPALDSSGTLYVGTQKGSLYAVDSYSGAQLWKYETGGAYSDWYASPVVGANGVIYLGNYDGSFYAIKDGEKLFSYFTNDIIIPSAAISQQGTIYFGSDSKKLYALVFDCPEGTYITPTGDSLCTDCPLGEYSDTINAESCSTCPYPWTSRFEGESSCQGLNFFTSTLPTVVTLCALAFMVLVGICSGEQRIAIFLNLLFPTLDVFSDLAYLLTNDFYSLVIFLLCLLSILLPSYHFCQLLVQHRAQPRLWWPIEKALWLQSGHGEDCIPHPVFPFLVHSEGRLPLLSTLSHSGFASVVLEGVAWVIAIAAQVLTIIAVVPGCVFFLAFWFLMGSFLHLTKLLAIGKVWNLWIVGWTQSDTFITDVDVDTAELILSLEQEFYLETLPQFAIQLANNLLLQRFTPIAAFSLALSVVMSINGIWRFLYPRYIAHERKELHEIPIQMVIGLGDWVLYDARIESGRKRGVGVEGDQAKEKILHSDHEEVDEEGPSAPPSDAPGLSDSQYTPLNRF